MRLIDKTLQDFSRLLGSATPIPGGGSSAAVEAALGMGLISKVALITMDKPAYTHCKDLMRHTAQTAAALGQDFLTWVDEDTAAYQDFLTAKRLPQQTAEQKAAYRQALYQALQACILVPYKILQAAVQGLHLGNAIAPDYYTGTASDLGLAALSLKTAAHGAHLTILMNLKSITSLGLPDHGFMESSFVQDARKQSQTLLDEAETAAKAIYTQVRKTLP
ncbi:MAG: cyclodeaminase/cyclohydrolase family protein [Treponema sp.]|nr:cyclodeaminase/cyclohydrolase family protein [Treponema sp.]